VVEEDIDPAELKAKLLEEEKSLTFEVERGNKILSNPGFLAKAPKEKVEAEQEKLLKNKSLLAAIEEKLKAL
jgi:valyl-tRNA synthetase